AEDLEGSGEVVGQVLDDDCVATEREVRPVLFARAHRYEEAGIALKNETHLVGDEGLEVQRRAHVALAGCAAAIAAAEWLHGSGAAWAWAAGAAGIVATLLALVRMPSPPRRPSPPLRAPPPGAPPSGACPPPRWPSPASSPVPRWCAAYCRCSGSNAAGPRCARAGSRGIPPP